MPQLTAQEIAELRTMAADLPITRKKVVELAFDLEGDQQITWQGGGNLDSFLKYSTKDRTPKPGAMISLVCWLWPIYLAWRAKLATPQHLADYQKTQAAAFGTAAVLHRPGVMTFGGRDESAMAAAAFYRAGISSVGLGIPGDIVFYYRSGYDQPCHVAVQVTNIHVSSLWTVPHDSTNLMFMWPQVVVSADLEREIIAGVGGGGTVVTRHRAAPWA